MKTLLKWVYLCFSLIILVYLSLPSSEFPNPPTDSIQSNEPADVETPQRRGYYTDWDRKQVTDYYQKQLSTLNFLDLPTPVYRLNYPPEDAQVLIRDQTQSTFLEEYVHPFRDSIFINGYTPTEPQKIIEIDGKIWNQKVIVRRVENNSFIRIVITMFGLVLFWYLASTVFSEFRTVFHLVITKVKTNYVKKQK